jgi:hypothetical protein
MAAGYGRSGQDIGGPNRVKIRRSTYSSLFMMVVPVPLPGLTSREQVRGGWGQYVGGPNRVKGRQNTYSSLDVTEAPAPLLGLASREQVRKGCDQDVGGPNRVKGRQNTLISGNRLRHRLLFLDWHQGSR